MRTQISFYGLFRDDYRALVRLAKVENCFTSADQSDQLGKMSWRGIHFDLKEGHLEGHLALNVASPAAGYAPSGRSIGSFIVVKTMFIHV